MYFSLIQASDRLIHVISVRMVPQYHQSHLAKQTLRPELDHDTYFNTAGDHKEQVLLLCHKVMVSDIGFVSSMIFLVKRSVICFFCSRQFDTVRFNTQH